MDCTVPHLFKPKHVNILKKKKLNIYFLPQITKKVSSDLPQTKLKSRISLIIIGGFITKTTDLLDLKI